ncbi:hypothetical protein AB0K51_19545 [Kitasatospora sp. NPDC049285]|uniref:hypothetical protein n=1 Tax=Kitasatospora sp. NPDC049285 TaxID=3157096 RepID=UPI00342C8CB1
MTFGNRYLGSLLTRTPQPPTPTGHRLSRELPWWRRYLASLIDAPATAPATDAAAPLAATAPRRAATAPPVLASPPQRLRSSVGAGAIAVPGRTARAWPGFVAAAAGLVSVVLVFVAVSISPSSSPPPGATTMPANPTSPPHTGNPRPATPTPEPSPTPSRTPSVRLVCDQATQSLAAFHRTADGTPDSRADAADRAVVELDRLLPIASAALYRLIADLSDDLGQLRGDQLRGDPSVRLAKIDADAAQLGQTCGALTRPADT